VFQANVRYLTIYGFSRPPRYQIRTISPKYALNPGIDGRLSFTRPTITRPIHFRQMHHSIFSRRARIPATTRWFAEFRTKAASPHPPC